MHPCSCAKRRNHVRVNIPDLPGQRSFAERGPTPLPVEMIPTFGILTTGTCMHPAAREYADIPRGKFFSSAHTTSPRGKILVKKEYILPVCHGFSDKHLPRRGARHVSRIITTASAPSGE